LAGPSGLLGVRWGADSGEAARRLDIACERWEPLTDTLGFEVCADPNHGVTAFGRPARLRLIRDGAGVAAMQLAFDGGGADWPAFTAAVIKELRLSADRGANTPVRQSLYETWRDGRVVHFSTPDSRDGCLLTVAGPAYGRAFQQMMLRVGLSGLGAGLTPR
jgi:hypothetical protein